MDPDYPPPDPNQPTPQEIRGLSMVTGGWGQEELDFAEKLNLNEHIPPWLIHELFSCFSNTQKNTNQDSHGIKSLRAGVQEMLAVIRYNMPPGRFDAKMKVLFKNIENEVKNNTAGCYQGFSRKQYNTRFAHVTSERNQPEQQKPGIMKRMLGF